MNIYFSDFFDVAPEVLEEYGAFNISLINDLPLFIDPFLLFNSEKPEYRVLHDGIIRYVAFLREQSVSRQGRLPKGLLSNWYRFKEVRQNWLGYSKVGNSGSALGAKFARSLNKNLYTLFPTFGQDGAEHISASSHLEKICLVSEGVGRDNISDFTTNLIKKYLLEYTQTFAAKYIRPQFRRRMVVNRVRFNYSTASWVSAAYELPYFRGDYVLLTPRDILSKDEMWINRDDLYEQYEDIAFALPNSELRDLVNEYFRSILPLNAKKDEKREAIKQVVHRYPAVLEYYIQRKEESGAEAVTNSAEQVIEIETLFIEQVRRFVETHLAGTSFYADIGDTVEGARSRALFLKTVIETNEGYKAFYIGDKPIERESDLQVLHRLIWYAAQPTVSPGYHGNGSKDGKEKSPIEFKLASNKHLAKVLEDYAKARAESGQSKMLVRVIFAFTPQEGQKIKAYIQELGLGDDPNVILINVMAKDSKPVDTSSTHDKTSLLTEGTVEVPMGQRLIHWLHLSDFHVGKDEYGQRQLFKQILTHVAERKHEGHIPDFVFITGDIANKGKKHEYDEFIDGFYRKLQSTLGEDWHGRLYLIPGNHDVERDKAKAVQRYGVLDILPDFLDPTMQGLNERRPLLPRFEGFINSALSPAEATWLTSKEGSFSEVVALKGYRLGVVGLNTAWLSGSDEDRHELTPGKDIVETALEAVVGSDITIVLGHHPLDWVLDRDVPALRALLGRSAAIYIHGHLHKGRSRHEEGAGYQFLTFQAGAAFQARESDIWVNGLMWCTLDIENRRVYAQAYQWSKDDQEWKINGSAFSNRFRQGDRWIFPLPSSSQTELANLRTSSGPIDVDANTTYHVQDAMNAGGPMKEVIRPTTVSGVEPLQLDNDRIREACQIALSELLALQYPWGEWHFPNTGPEVEHRRDLEVPRTSLAVTLQSIEALSKFSIPTIERRKNRGINWMLDGISEGWHWSWATSQPENPDSRSTVPSLKRRKDVRHTAEVASLLCRYREHYAVLAELLTNVAGSIQESGLWPEWPDETRPQLTTSVFAVEALGYAQTDVCIPRIETQLKDTELSQVRSAFNRGLSALQQQAHRGHGLLGYSSSTPLLYVTGLAVCRFAPLGNTFQAITDLLETLISGIATIASDNGWSDSSIWPGNPIGARRKSTMRMGMALVLARRHGIAVADDIHDLAIRLVLDSILTNKHAELDAIECACALNCLLPLLEDARLQPNVELAVATASSRQRDLKPLWIEWFHNFNSKLSSGRKLGIPEYEELGQTVDRKLDLLLS